MSVSTTRSVVATVFNVDAAVVFQALSETSHAPGRQGIRSSILAEILFSQRGLSGTWPPGESKIILSCSSHHACRKPRAPALARAPNILWFRAGLLAAASTRKSAARIFEPFFFHHQILVPPPAGTGLAPRWSNESGPKLEPASAWVLVGCRGKHVHAHFLAGARVDITTNNTMNTIPRNETNPFRFRRYCVHSWLHNFHMNPPPS